MNEINQLFKALEFIHKFENVFRKSPVKGRSFYQTDAEHSFELAFICLFLIDKFSLTLNKEKVMYYALFHDLVEIYSGDVVPYNISHQKIVAQKVSQETTATKRIISEFPHFSTLKQYLTQYEEKLDPESNFVYVIDKILPVINTSIAENDFYIANKVTYNDFRGWLSGKIAKAKFLDKATIEIINQVLKYFEENPQQFFQK